MRNVDMRTATWSVRHHEPSGTALTLPATSRQARQSSAHPRPDSMTRPKVQTDPPFSRTTDHRHAFNAQPVQRGVFFLTPKLFKSGGLQNCTAMFELTPPNPHHRPTTQAAIPTLPPLFGLCTNAVTCSNTIKLGKAHSALKGHLAPPMHFELPDRNPPRNPHHACGLHAFGVTCVQSVAETSQAPTSFVREPQSLLENPTLVRPSLAQSHGPRLLASKIRR